MPFSSAWLAKPQQPASFGAAWPILRDRDEVFNLSDAVGEALAQPSAMIVRSFRLPQQQAEVLAFKRLGHEQRVFRLITGSEPCAGTASGRAGEECLVLKGKGLAMPFPGRGMNPPARGTATGTIIIPGPPGALDR